MKDVVFSFFSLYGVTISNNTFYNTTAMMRGGAIALELTPINVLPIAIVQNVFNSC